MDTLPINRKQALEALGTTLDMLLSKARELNSKDIESIDFENLSNQLEMCVNLCKIAHNTKYSKDTNFA